MELGRHAFELDWPDEPSRTLRGRVVVAADTGGAAGSTPRPHVLLVHGHRGFMDWSYFPLLADRLAGAGLAVVAFNLSGSGIGPDLTAFTDPEAFAANTYTRELEDLDRVRAEIDRGALPGVDPARRGIYGHSRGGGMALLHAADHGDYTALCLWAPMHRVALFGAESRRSFERRGHILSPLPTGGVLRLDRSVLDDAERNAERLDIGRACARLRAPTRVLYGSRDRLLEEGAATALETSFPPGVATFEVIEGGNHTLGARHPLATTPAPLERGLSKTVEWFVRHLTEPAARIHRPDPTAT